LRTNELEIQSMIDFVPDMSCELLKNPKVFDS